MAQWVCKRCGWQGDEPTICPAMSGGKVVDIIDIMCPNCPAGEPRLEGTQEEKDKWWNNYYDQQEGKSDIR